MAGAPRWKVETPGLNNTSLLTGGMASRKVNMGLVLAAAAELASVGPGGRTWSSPVSFHPGRLPGPPSPTHQLSSHSARSFPLFPILIFPLLGVFFSSFLKKSDLIAFLRLLQSGALPRKWELPPRLCPMLVAALASAHVSQSPGCSLRSRGHTLPYHTLCPSAGLQVSLATKEWRWQWGCRQ